MKKFLFYFAILWGALYQETIAQCTFNVPQNFGFLCEEAHYLCGSELDGYQSTLLQDLSPLPQPDPICGGGSPENTQWFSFIADDINLAIDITYSNCTFEPQGPGLSVGLYADCNLSTMTDNNQHLICETVQGYTTISLVPDPDDIEAGNIYYLYVDGYAGAACDFEISVISGVCTEAPPADQPCPQDCGVTNTYADHHGCTGFVETYNFLPSSQILEDILGCNPFLGNAELDSIICIEWEITPATGYIIGNTTYYYDSIDVRSSINVQWQDAGVYTIKPIININPLFETCRAMCLCTDDLAYQVTIEESNATTLDPITLCPGDCVDFCNQTYCDAVTVNCYDRDSCSVITQEIIASPINFVDIGEYYICDGECFIFNGVPYCSANIFSVPHPTACDTSYVFELIELELTSELSIADSVIDCANNVANLQGEWSTNFPNGVLAYWISETGDTVSYSSDYSTSEAGTYTFLVVPEGIEECGIYIEHQIIRDDSTPDVMLVPVILDCDNPTDMIGVNTTATIASISWTGPNGFVSNDISPAISEGGNYTAEIVADNGCQITESIEIFGDFTDPVIVVAHDDIDCTDNLHTATFTSSLDIDEIDWQTPSGSHIDDEVLNLTETGSYTLTVTSTNGCTAESTFTVSDLSYNPSSDILEDTILRCNQTEIIQEFSTLNSDFDYTFTELSFGTAIPVTNGDIMTLVGTGTWVLTISDPVVGCIGYDTLRITEDPNLFTDITFEIQNPLCNTSGDGSIEISEFIGGEGPYTYLYLNESFDDISEINFTSGSQTLTILDNFGCEVIKTFDMPVTNNFEVVTDTDVYIKYGETGELEATATIDDSQILSITWTNLDGDILADGSPVDIDADQEVIVVTIEDVNGCIATAQININIDYEVDIFYPNVFSPNGDGNNDFFMLYNNGRPEALDDLKIFDRAGELIYQNNSLLFNETASGWNGEFNGSPVVPGVYVFIMNYTLGNGEKRTKSGSITVMK